MNRNTALAIVLRQGQAMQRDYERMCKRYPQAMRIEQAKALEALRPMIAPRETK